MYFLFPFHTLVKRLGILTINTNIGLHINLLMLPWGLMHQGHTGQPLVFHGCSINSIKKQKLGEINMPRFFNIEEVTKVATLTAPGGLIFVFGLYVLYRKIVV